MVELRDVGKSFGSHDVLCGVNATLEEVKLYGLIGRSGGGKSVLLKLIAGIETVSSGEIDLHGLPAEKITLMFQEGALFDSLSVVDNVAFPLVNGKVPIGYLEVKEREAVFSRVTAILRRVGLTRAAFKIPAELSGGMRRRVALARALVARPKLLLLDDPTAGLDPIASAVIMQLILELSHELSATTIIVSHDLRRLLPVVDEVLALVDGRIAFQGPPVGLRSRGDDELTRFVQCRFELAQLV